MKNPRPEEEKIIIDTSNLFRLNNKAKGMKGIVLKGIMKLFENEE